MGAGPLPCIPPKPAGDLRNLRNIRISNIFRTHSAGPPMKTFSAADLSRNTGDLLDAASRAPVAITRHRKPRFVVMSFEQFEALTHAGGRKAYGVDELPPEIGAALDAALDRDLGDG